jgi:hypothetical protein
MFFFSGLIMISGICRTSLHHYLTGNIPGLSSRNISSGAVLFDPELFKNMLKILDLPLWEEEMYLLS